MNSNPINDPGRRGDEEDERRWAEVGRLTSQWLHDLKNHIGGIKLFAGYLKKKFSDQPEVVDVSERILGGLQKITEDAVLVGQLVKPLTLQAVALPDLLQRIFAELAPQGSEHGVQLDWEAPAGIAFEIMAEPSLMHRALAALLKQALAISPAHGAVQLRIRREGNQCMMDLLFRGEGLEGKLFRESLIGREPSARLPLDLLLARHIVEIHHGRIEAGDSSEAALTVRLPAADRTS